MTGDEELYMAWAGGDRRAGEQLIERHLRPMARYFANKVTNVADRDELVSETFEACARGLGRFRGAGSFRAYLFGIAFNVLRHYLRARLRQPDFDPEVLTLSDALPSPSQQLARRREQQLLLAGLRSLPLQTQIVLELNYFEGLGRHEIAELLGEPPGTIASRLRRGRHHLDEALAALAENASVLESTRRGLDTWAAQIRDLVG
jgi:RNA polymerase sigma-70 factor (ECF subfamily)